MKRRQVTQVALSVGLMTSVAGCSGESTSSNSVTDTDSDGVPDEHDYAPTDPDVQSKSDTESTAEPEPRWTAYRCDEGEFKFQILDVSFDRSVMSVVIKNITTSQIEVAKVIVFHYHRGELETEEFDVKVDRSNPVVGTYGTLGIDCDLSFGNIDNPNDIESIEIKEPIVDISDGKITCS